MEEIQNRKTVFLALIITMIIGLTQIQCPSVSATIPKTEETILHPISGSDVDNRKFTYYTHADHLIFSGFAVAVSMDLPTPVAYNTRTKVGFAVGLGDPWTDIVLYPFAYDKYTPYVKEMWIKVQGDNDYSVDGLGGIVDNTGTGDPSWEYFPYILDFIGCLFTAYEIYNWVREVRQGPLSQEWDRGIHYARPIVRQSGNWNSRPQTACAEFWGSFNREGRNTFTITAEASIWLRHEKVAWGWYTDTRIPIGTYKVSYVVEFTIGIHKLSVRALDQYGYSLVTGDVYIDGNLSGYTWEDYSVQYGTHEVFVNDFWERGDTGNRYGFQHWEDGSTTNPRTVTMNIDKTIIAYFKKKWCPADIDGNGIVDSMDVLVIGLSFGSKRDLGDPCPVVYGEWNSIADVFTDDWIDIMDCLCVGLYFGYEYPDP